MTVAALCLSILLYVYVGYPLLLALVVRVRGARPIARGDDLPAVSLVISAYNEAGVIRRKLENATALDYPKDRLEIVVVSDASTDATDAIAAEFAGRGVRVARQEARLGKTAGLNRVVPTLRGDVVVFSDANAMYQPDALRMLVRNFADPRVGCVAGEARYLEGQRTAADAGERGYWQYEIQLKRLETAVGSMVGGDGAIYAIRAQLWQPLPATAINDFLNPLQIVHAGWRAVYEPDAICYEETAGSSAREYHRRVRIVSRSLRAVLTVPGVLNPFRTGWFALSVVSHKMLRWMTGALVAGTCAGVVFAALTMIPMPPAASWSVLVLGATVVCLRPGRRAVSLAGYFSVVQAASLVGVVKGLTGQVSGTWAPPRESPAASGARRRIGTPSRRLRTAVAPAARTLAYRSGVCHAIRRYRPNRGLAILRYHAICGPEGYGYADPHLCVSPAAFERQVAHFAAHYHVLSLPEAVARLRSGRPLPENGVVFTFDDGYADNLPAARTLHRYGATGTFYITAGCLADGQPFWPSEIRYLVGAIPAGRFTLHVPGRQIDLDCGTPEARAAALWTVTCLLKAHPIPVRDDIRQQLRRLAGDVPLPTIMLNWDELGEMARLGMTIGAHTVTHPNLPSAGLAAATDEIIASKRLLEARVGTEVTMFSYPNGGAERYYTPELQAAVARAGFAAATTSRNGFATRASDLYAIERVQVAERLEDLLFRVEVERVGLFQR